MLFKIFAVLMLLLIVASLFTALISMARGDEGASRRRTARALTTRIALSLFLFSALFIAWHFGWLTPGS